jgi:hypothetical protein
MISHLYIQVDDDKDELALEELLIDNEYDYYIASSEGLPNDLEDFRRMVRDPFNAKAAEDEDEGEEATA